jgi:hypothetical protein
MVRVLKLLPESNITAYFQAIHDQKVADGMLFWQQQQSMKCDKRRDNMSRSGDCGHSSPHGKEYDRRHDDPHDRGYGRNHGWDCSHDTYPTVAMTATALTIAAITTCRIAAITILTRLRHHQRQSSNPSLICARITSRWAAGLSHGGG